MTDTITIAYHNTPFGELILGDYQGGLCLADWRYRKMRSSIDKRIQTGLQSEYKEGSTETLSETKRQIDAYIRGELSDFNIPLKLVGTDFQQSVWQALMKIPYGSTETYLGLSKKLGDEKAIRAVATANGANAISIIVPCHRIIGSDGSLVGYAGGLPAKKKLLKLEGALDSSQMDLFD